MGQAEGEHISGKFENIDLGSGNKHIHLFKFISFY